MPTASVTPVTLPWWGRPLAWALGLTVDNVHRMIAHVGAPVTRVTIRFTVGVNTTGLAWDDGYVEIMAGCFTTRTRAEWAVLHELTHQRGHWRHGRAFRRALLNSARTWFNVALPSSLLNLRGTDYAFDRAAVTLLESA